MKILITGGAGFIGSALIRYIMEHTLYSVINVDKLTYAGNLTSLIEYKNNDRYNFEQVDICNADEMTRIFSTHQPDTIMHLAAESHVDRSIEGPAAFIQTNIIGTYTLLEVCRAYWVNLSEIRKLNFRFHHISTDEVYGDLYNSNEFFTETTAYAPSSPYSASKASSDHLVRAWFRTYGLPILITNCSNNYGPYQFPEKLIPLTILNALSQKPLLVYGDGSQVRDWLYVHDHARALLLVLEKGQVGSTYAVGGHNEKTNVEVMHIICSLLEELVPVKPEGLDRYQDLIMHVKDRPGHDRRYAIDAAKIKNDLGWVPAESFETGIRKTIEWYLNNREWHSESKDSVVKPTEIIPSVKEFVQ